jgi:hypothetical protein
MDAEMRRLRAMLARREGGRGRRFAPDLRRQITAVGRGLRTEGKTWFRSDARSGCPQRRCGG